MNRQQDQAVSIDAVNGSFVGQVYGNQNNTFVHNFDSVRVREERVNEILRTLYIPSNIETKSRIPDPTNGTCKWFLDNPHFWEWMTRPSATMLLVSALPGCGKSVLAKGVIDTLSKTLSSTTCYFFFRDDDENQKVANNALSSIIHQLFTQRRPLLNDDILRKFEISGSRLTQSFSELWEIFLAATQDENAGQIFCVLDGLDECDDSRTLLVKAFRRFYISERNFRIKFLLTNRRFHEFQTELSSLTDSGLPVKYLKGESNAEIQMISREINIFVKTRIHEIVSKHKLDEEKEELLLRSFLKEDQKTYLWAHLTLDLIEKEVCITTTRIQELVASLPKSVYAAYDRILSGSRDQVAATRLLQIILAAMEPLTLEELNTAFHMKTDHQYSTHLESDEVFSAYVRSICGDLVIIVESKVSLLHQTAREFLIRHDGNPSNEASVWERSISLKDSHYLLLDVCVQYLRSRDVVYSESNRHRLDRNSNPFLYYAASHWTSHYYRSKLQPDNSLTASIKLLLDCWWIRECLEKYCHAYKFPPDSNTISLASSLGLCAVVKHLLQKGDDSLDHGDMKYGRSALSWAAGNGHKETVEAFIQHNHFWLFPFKRKITVDSIDNYYRTPLVYATWRGSIEIVNLLLDAGASVNAADKNGTTPWHYSVFGGKTEISRLMQKKKPLLNLDAAGYISQLTKAIEETDVTAFNELLHKYDATSPYRIEEKDWMELFKKGWRLRNYRAVRTLYRENFDYIDKDEISHWIRSVRKGSMDPNMDFNAQLFLLTIQGKKRRAPERAINYCVNLRTL